MSGIHKEQVFLRVATELRERAREADHPLLYAAGLTVGNPGVDPDA